MHGIRGACFTVEKRNLSGGCGLGPQVPSLSFSDIDLDGIVEYARRTEKSFGTALEVESCCVLDGGNFNWDVVRSQQGMNLMILTCASSQSSLSRHTVSCGVKIYNDRSSFRHGGNTRI